MGEGPSYIISFNEYIIHLHFKHAKRKKNELITFGMHFNKSYTWILLIHSAYLYTFILGFKDVRVRHFKGLGYQQLLVDIVLDFGLLLHRGIYVHKLQSLFVMIFATFSIFIFDSSFLGDAVST